MELKRRGRDIIWIALVAAALAVPAAIADEAGTAGVKQKANKALKKAKKANKKAKNALAVAEETSKQQGPQGPQGPQGVKGDTGDPATSLWAVVNTDGTLVRNSGATGVTKGTAGIYVVEFNQDITGCSWTTALADPTNNPPSAGATRSNWSGINNQGIRVRVSDLGGVLTDMPFHIQVFC